MKSQNRNVKSVRKVRSFADKAVQLADFISGSVREKYENDDEQYITVIEEKISIAHETLWLLTCSRLMGLTWTAFC